MIKKIKCILTAVFFTALIGLLIFPLIATAGSLEPSAQPAPTMRTLDEIQPTWSKKIPCSVDSCPRFQVLADFNNEAVLDRETGLVWEKSPATNTYVAWVSAINRCTQLDVGGRKGWHLPTIDQLASLADSTQSLPSLPGGHPFQNIQYDSFWSATTFAQNTSEAWLVNFEYGNVSSYGKNNWIHSWCVRGGQSNDAN